MQEASPSRYFVVREEAGEYEYVDQPSWYRLRREVPIFGVQVGATKVIYDRIVKAHGINPFRRVNEHGEMIEPPRRIATKRDLEFWDQGIFDALSEIYDQVETQIELYESEPQDIIDVELDRYDYSGLPEPAVRIAALMGILGTINAAEMILGNWTLSSDPKGHARFDASFEEQRQQVQALIKAEMPAPVGDEDDE